MLEGKDHIKTITLRNEETLVAAVVVVTIIPETKCSTVVMATEAGILATEATEVPLMRDVMAAIGRISIRGLVGGHIPLAMTHKTLSQRRRS